MRALFGAQAAAALSLDKQFLAKRGRAAGHRHGAASVKEHLLDGSEALAAGFFYGVRGVLVKPVQGAREGGVQGFTLGVGHGLLGAVTQPTSGVLDAMSKVQLAARRCLRLPKLRTLEHRGHGQGAQAWLVARLNTPELFARVGRDVGGFRQVKPRG